MKNHRIPSMILALVLQVVPISRVALLNPAVAQTGFAILLRWTAGAGVLLGAVDAVSGASAAISGLQAYVGTTKLGGLTFTPTVPEGISNLTLRIVVSNPGSDHQQDYWNCTPLPPSLTISTNFGGSGYITNIPGRLTLAGVYPVTLLAGNQNFGAVTANAIITVQASGGTAPSITSQPQSLTVTNGDPASFTVVATGSPTPSYQWRKGGVNLGGATSASYTLGSVSTNDAGAYDVVVSNSAGSTNSAAATLTVLVPPSIITPPADQTVTAGANVSFSVTAAGDRPLGYRWEHGGTNIAGATSAVLQLGAVQVSDSGTYTVTVTNATGSTSASALLTVNAADVAPTITTQPQSLTVTNGDPASFTVVATGSPAPNYQWRKDGVNLGGATSASYTLNSVSTNDAGSYDVVVSNSAGSTNSTTATLTVLMPGLVPITLGNVTLSNGFPTFVITGPPNSSLVTWSSSNLLSWSPVGTNFTASGTLLFIDLSSPSGATLFYRTTQGP